MEQEKINIEELEKKNQELRNTPFWYAMRVTYRHEELIRDELDNLGMETFLPMVRRTVKQRGRIKHVIEPAINSLLFIHDSEVNIQRRKEGNKYLQYIMAHGRDGSSRKLTVPDRQMQDFINLYNLDKDLLQFYQDGELQLKPGQKVQITVGPLQGQIGTFQRVQGSRSKRFILTLPGLLSAVSASVTPDQIMPIKDDESDAFVREED